MKPVRTERVSSLLKEELSDIVRERYPFEEFGLITVTEVRMSPDLRVAKVYVSIFADAEKKHSVMKRIESEKAQVRTDLARRISLRVTPELIFMLDESLDQAMNIAKLLDEIKAERALRSEKREGGKGVQE